MFLSDASVRRPVAMSCLIIGLLLLGANSYRKLGLELMPKIDMPMITIVTAYPGASPNEIETDIAKRIEDKVSTLDGLKHVNSTCMEDVCITMLEFQLGVDVDIAATDVREKLDLVKPDLPSGAEDPTIQKLDLNAKPVVTMAFTGDLTLEELYDYADNKLRDRISVIRGVADVSLVGGAKREVHVMLDRDKLAARRLTALQVMQTVQSNLGTVPSGRVRDSGTEYSVKFDADFRTAEEIGNLEVRNEDDKRCYLRDVGEVKMTTAEVRRSATWNNQGAVAIKIVKKSDANAADVVAEIRKAMDKLNAELPGGMKLIWFTDDGIFIKATNDSAWINVFEGILLTAAILFLFLYNLRALFVVGITMPVTIVIGLFFMQWAGFTLNTSTLIAMGMSVGILVTNSIVVLEAIVKRLNGQSPVSKGTSVLSNRSPTDGPDISDRERAKNAARMGTKEVTTAVLASAGTNIVVLFPLGKMGSLVGLFIQPLAITMLIMTGVSLFISFTLTPLLCSLVLKPTNENSRGPLAFLERWWNRGFDRIVVAYRWILLFCERYRWAAVTVLLLTFGIFVHSLSLAGKLGSSMVEESDRGEVFIKMEFPTRYSLEKTKIRVAEAEKRLQGATELKGILSTIGLVEGDMAQASEGVYLAQILLKYSERTERSLTIHDLMKEVRKRMEAFPDAIVSVSMPSIIGGQAIPIQMEISGDRLEVLDKLAKKAENMAQNMDGFRDTDTTVRYGKPQVRIRPQRAVLGDREIAARDLGFSLRGNLEGIEAGSFKKDARNYDIVVKLKEEEGRGQVEQFNFPGEAGLPVPLTTMGKVQDSQAPVQITRKNKQRISKLYSFLASDLPLGAGVEKIDKAMKEEGNIPPGYSWSFAGDYEYMNEGQEALGEAGLISMVLVFLTLAAILESFRQPLLILVTVPLALIGTIWALYLTGQSMGIFVIMGFVMMIGIVVNNAILIMDQFNVHVAEGIPRHKAMIYAACERFRPIIMITLAAVLGMVPLGFGQGIGAEIRNGVGIASMGGILVSGFLTLLVMPILYDLFTRKGKKVEPQD